MTTNKPEVKRYDCTSGGSAHCYGCYTMTESEHGEYVSAEDYEALQTEIEKLKSYYRNGIDCFANPCPDHSGEKTPPLDVFFEKYGGLCLLCVVEESAALKAKVQVLSRKCDNIISVMEGYQHLEKQERQKRQDLQAEYKQLLSIICDIKYWDCDCMGGCLSLPLALRQRMQSAIDAATAGGAE